jgi:hypothetical protein
MVLMMVRQEAGPCVWRPNTRAIFLWLRQRILNKRWKTILGSQNPNQKWWSDSPNKSQLTHSHWVDEGGIVVNEDD